MNAGTIRSVVVITASALLAGGCAELTPGENAGVFGGLSGVAAGSIARAAGMSTAESIATGAAVGAVVAVTTYIIAKHQATERQRRVAEERARVAAARIQRQREADARKSAQSGHKARKAPRYIAVDTVKDERTSPKARKSVMIFDTQSNEIVGNNVYDVESAPAVGTTARFETYSAEYVGTGS